MYKNVTTIIATVIFSVSASSQIGVGRIKGFVSTSKKNSSEIIATVELKTIENWAKNNFTTTVETNDGQYSFEVSFGYYLLTITAKGYETYQTKIHIPSSSTLEWTTILKKSDAKVDNSKK